MGSENPAILALQCMIGDLYVAIVTIQHFNIYCSFPSSFPPSPSPPLPLPASHPLFCFSLEKGLASQRQYPATTYQVAARLGNPLLLCLDQQPSRKKGSQRPATESEPAPASTVRSHTRKQSYTTVRYVQKAQVSSMMPPWLVGLSLGVPMSPVTLQLKELHQYK